jgi:hypothetical protein
MENTLGIRIAVDSGNTKLFSANVIQFGAGYRMVGKTCPSTCPLLEKGCYAKGGNTAIHMRDRWSSQDGKRLFETVTGTNAKGKPNFKQGAYFRLTVSGDIMLDDVLDTEFLQGIIDSANARPDMTFYSYTHYKGEDLLPWLAKMPKNVTINISCDTNEDIEWAVKNNLPYVIVKDLGKKRIGNMLQCPNQTVGIKCDECKLCFKSDRPFNIAFVPHGAAAKSIKARDRIELSLAA